MKIYVNKLNENWIVDRYRKDWYSSYKKFSTYNIFFSDIIWIIAPWTWKKRNSKLLLNKKVICTLHHIEMNDEFIKKFQELDPYVDFFHVISEKTYQQLKEITEKKVFLIPWWVDDSNWFEINNKMELRDQFGIESTKYVVGSFQRDTEGSDLISPKLIKGPDIFIKIVNELNNKNKNLLVLLTGTRRNYVINELKTLNIQFKYFEMVSIEDLNKLYNILDLYIVASRLEGGPQAIVECALTKTPIISSDVGIASQFLHQNSIFPINPKMSEVMKAKPNIDYAYEKVQKIVGKKGLEVFFKMFQEIYES